MNIGIRQKTLGNRTGKGVNKKIIVCLLTGCLMCIALFAEAQQPKKVARIGYLLTGNAAGVSPRFEGIRLALRERGYIEGQNIAIEDRYAEGKRDRLPELATELVRLKVDIIVAVGGGTHRSSDAI
jgi:putative ABC transport system substrate-binding protein